MSQLSHYTQAEIIAELKSIAPSQFEKKFKGFELPQIAKSFAKATYGLDRKAVELGFDTIWEKGFLPDPIMFRQWCLGNRDFSFDDEIADSYVGKHGALNNIIAWLENDKTTAISTAEKQAYDACYTLWQGIHSEKDRTRAELAFKDCYEKIVKGLVKARVMCQPYTPPVAIATKDAKKDAPASREFAMDILKNIGKSLRRGAAA